MQHFNRHDTLETIGALQQSYDHHEMSARGRYAEYRDWFAPTFEEFGVALGNDRVIDVMSDEEQATLELANTLSEPHSSHVMVIMRTNGDNHAIATHQSGNQVHIFDPNHGEYTFRRADLQDGIRSVIGAYSELHPVPEIRLLSAHP